jgi:hypothetical protein
MGRPFSTHRTKRNAYKVLVGKLEGHREQDDLDIG